MERTETQVRKNLPSIFGDFLPDFCNNLYIEKLCPGGGSANNADCMVRFSTIDCDAQNIYKVDIKESFYTKEKPITTYKTKEVIGGVYTEDDRAITIRCKDKNIEKCEKDIYIVKKKVSLIEKGCKAEKCVLDSHTTQKKEEKHIPLTENEWKKYIEGDGYNIICRSSVNKKEYYEAQKEEENRAKVRETVGTICGILSQD